MKKYVSMTIVESPLSSVLGPWQAPHPFLCVCSSRAETCNQLITNNYLAECSVWL